VPGDPVAGVVIRVLIEQQRQPRAGADLDQRERLRQFGEGGQKGGAPGGFVRLRPPQHHFPGQLSRILRDQCPQPIDVGRFA
jgi:hypothetical protein